MIRLKNKRAFTLIEVLLALAIAGVVLGPLYFAQGTMVNRIMKIAESVQRLFMAYDFFAYESFDEGKEVVTQDVADPKTKFMFQEMPLSQKSFMVTQFNHMKMQKISWNWTYLDAKQHDQFVIGFFDPPEKKEEKQEEQAKPASQSQEKAAAKAGIEPASEKPSAAQLKDKKGAT